MALPGNPAFYEPPAGQVANVSYTSTDTAPEPVGYMSLIVAGLVVLALAFIVRGIR